MQNNTQTVDSIFCEDAGLSIPDKFERCGGMECSRWEIEKWVPCPESRCISQNKAIQGRAVKCRFSNGTESKQCDPVDRPLSRQECYNERCKPMWRMEEWSEVRKPYDTFFFEAYFQQCSQLSLTRPFNYPN